MIRVESQSLYMMSLQMTENNKIKTGSLYSAKLEEKCNRQEILIT